MTHPLQPVPESVTEEQMRAAFGGDLPRLTGPILIADPTWPEVYAREAARLRELLGGRVLALEHVGSTAVPGLPAKPIIDIDLSLVDSADEAAYVPLLEAAGYRLTVREPDWYEHRLFKGPGANINLHVWTLGSPEALRHRIFRDWLRLNAEDRGRYGDLKRELATRDFTYVYEYNNAKAPLIHDIYTRALAAYDAGEV